MKVTSLKDMDSYIYSKVVLPLKDLDVDGLIISSPMIRENRYVELYVNDEETGHISYSHQYQREEARMNTMKLVMLRYGNSRHVLADYNTKTHAVNVYASPFEALESGKMLMNRLIQAFNNYTPFTRVTIKDTARTIYANIEQPPVAEDNDDYDDSEEDYDD